MLLANKGYGVVDCICSAWVGVRTLVAYPDTGIGVNQTGQGKW